MTVRGCTLIFTLAAFLAVPAGAAYGGRTAKANDLYRRGQSHDEKKEYSQAVRCYSEALKLKPDSARFYYSRGRAYRLMSRLNDSVKDLSKAISLKPGYDDAYNNRGIAYMDLGRPREAENDFRKACGHGLNEGCMNLKKLLEEKK